MGPGAIAAITAGADLLTGAFSASSARGAFKTRYQDTVKDMRKAGLNPALAYGQGGGNPQTVPLPQVGDNITEGIKGSATAQQARAQTELTRAQTDLLKAQKNDIIRRTTAQADLALRDSILREYQGVSEGIRSRTLEQTQPSEVMTARTLAELARLSLPEARAAAKYFEGIGRYQPYMNNALDILRTVAALRGSTPAQITKVYPR